MSENELFCKYDYTEIQNNVYTCTLLETRIRNHLNSLFNRIHENKCLTFKNTKLTISFQIKFRNSQSQGDCLSFRYKSTSVLSMVTLNQKCNKTSLRSLFTGLEIEEEKSAL